MYTLCLNFLQDKQVSIPEREHIMSKTERLKKEEKKKVPLKSKLPPVLPHMALFQRWRNSGVTHVSGSTVKYVEHSRLYRAGGPALIRAKQPWLYLFSFA